ENTSTPEVGLGALTFDPGLGNAVLFGPNLVNAYANDSMWSFADGSWHTIPLMPVGFDPGAIDFPTMTYDAAAGGILLLQGNYNSSVGNATSPGGVTESWIYFGSRWAESGSLPFPYLGGFGSMAYYPASSDVVEFGGLASSNRTAWVYSQGNWTNSSAYGPTYRVGDAMAYDPTLGAVVMFGGDRRVPPDLGYPKNDTWIYGYPTESLKLAVSEQPSEVCSVASPACGLGINETRITITATGTRYVSQQLSTTDNG
ncbi:hypothetical protein B2A_15141, partial [mine drainage metagenome]